MTEQTWTDEDGVTWTRYGTHGTYLRQGPYAHSPVHRWDECVAIARAVAHLAPEALGLERTNQLDINGEPLYRLPTPGGDDGAE
jgi:hypothetical protein